MSDAMTLKGCPFCGAAGAQKIVDDGKGYYVLCLSCDAHGRRSKVDWQTARMYWNAQLKPRGKAQ